MYHVEHLRRLYEELDSMKSDIRGLWEVVDELRMKIDELEERLNKLLRGD